MKLDATVFEDAARLVRQGFTCDALARTAHGMKVMPYNEQAVYFSMLGAICRAHHPYMFTHHPWLKHYWRVALSPPFKHVSIYGGDQDEAIFSLETIAQRLRADDLAFADLWACEASSHVL